MYFLVKFSTQIFVDNFPLIISPRTLEKISAQTEKKKKGEIQIMYRALVVIIAMLR
jgi:hypothetical protein